MIEHYWKTPIYTGTITDPEKYALEAQSFFDLDNPPSDNEGANIFETNFEGLSKQIYDHLYEFIKKVPEPDSVFMKGWITGSVNGYNMTHHNHSGSHISGVVYLQAEEGGDIILSDPRINANRGYPSEFAEMMQFQQITIKPTTGMILLFPSFVYHEVPTYKGRSRRIALPIDFFFKE
jgi:uncharacterized protein (TIGR02466 family)